ncbi:hypothetical protein U9M48_003421 [Paspalum notatum var. saurae]|uniref:Uncharacterized protein n=1 Tax=Paspalum notatum var. saurae TaxID=547442 RepID=A0AAQ3SJW0_PASNO
MEHVGTSPSATPLPFATTMKPPSVMQLGKPRRPYATLATPFSRWYAALPSPPSPGGLDAWIVTPTAEESPRLEAIADYLVALNTDYNALHRVVHGKGFHVSAQITPSMPLFNPVYYPPRKRVRYNDPTARTYIRHP